MTQGMEWMVFEPTNDEHKKLLFHSPLLLPRRPSHHWRSGLKIKATFLFSFSCFASKVGAVLNPSLTFCCFAINNFQTRSFGFIVCAFWNRSSSFEIARVKRILAMFNQLARASSLDSLKVLEDDIQHANTLAAAIPRTKGGSHLQMKLVYNHWAPLFLFFLQWVDCSCTCLLSRYLNFFHILIYKVYTDGRANLPMMGRKATIRDFYAVILPSLERLHSDLKASEIEKDKHLFVEKCSKKCPKKENRFISVDLEREDECGICLEPCSKIVLPSCCHAMCIKCYRKWNIRSQSCPFCRGGLKRVKSEDLWVLTCSDDVVDNETISNEDLLRFYLYINRLPKDYPDALFLMYYEYLF